MKRLVAYCSYDLDGSIRGVSCVLPTGVEVEVDGSNPIPRLCHRLAGMGFGKHHLTVIDHRDTPIQNCVIGAVAISA